MARSTTAPLLALLLLAAVAPVAGAAEGLPPPFGDTERVTRYYWQTPAGWCSSYDPVVGVASTALPSTASTEPVEGGTRYDLHLESLAPGPECPELDLSFVSPLAPWPTEPFSYADVTSPCGATGSLFVHASPEGRFLQVNVHLPEACGGPVVGWLLVAAALQPLQPSEYLVCAPVEVVLTPCVGAAEREDSWYWCPDGSRNSSTYVPWVVEASRRCDYQTGEDVVFIGPVVGVVWIEAGDDSCTLVVSDFFFGLVEERAPCPAEVGALLHGQDWGHMLP